MPATSKSQQRLFSMALAVRKGDLPRSKVWKAVLDIVDSDMTNKEIEDFTVLKESNKYRTMKPLSEYMAEAMVSEAFQAFASTTETSGSNPPMSWDDYKRVDAMVHAILSDGLDDQVSTIGEKNVGKYKAWLEANSDKLNMFTLYMNKYGKFAIMLNNRATTDDAEYYIMISGKNADEMVLWLKANLSKCITFAKKYTNYKG